MQSLNILTLPKFILVILTARLDALLTLLHAKLIADLVSVEASADGMAGWLACKC